MTSTSGRFANASVTTPKRGRSTPPIDPRHCRATAYRSLITEPLIKSRSGAMIGALAFSTLATGLLQICLPLELVQLRASPEATGLTLSMFGFGMFAFEWLWGVVADRVGYRAPLIASKGLYAGFIVLLFRVDSVALNTVRFMFAYVLRVSDGPY